jgi:cell wall-associated NlpC family hydrolase
MHVQGIRNRRAGFDRGANLNAQLAADLQSNDPARMSRALDKIRSMPPGEVEETINSLSPEMQALLQQLLLSRGGTAFANDNQTAPVTADVASAAPISSPQPTAAPAAATGGAPASGAAPGAPSGNAAVDKAMSHLGTAYNYSHARPPPPGQMDCSQLVSSVYPGMPPDVVTQGKMGTQLGGPENAQAGDLVFFDENGSGVATHVGIADGKGNVIHASDYTGEVSVTPISQISSTRTWATRP